MTAQEQVLLFINRNDGHATHAELMANCKLERQQVDYAITGLIADGLIRRLFNVYQLPKTRFIPAAIADEPKKERRKRSSDLDQEEKRLCIGCQLPKPISQFYSTKETLCRICRRANNAAWAAKKRRPIAVS